MDKLTTNAELAAEYGMTEEAFCELLGGLGLLVRGEDGNWHPSQEMLDGGYAMEVMENLNASE